MANEVTTTSADDLVYAAEIATDGILQELRANNNAASLVRFHSIAGFPSIAKDFPKLPTLTAAAVNEATDLSNSAYATTKVTLTSGEVGLMTTLTDVLSYSDIVSDDVYVQSAARALLTKITVDIAALGAGFTSSVGSTGVNLTEANILDAIATLEAANAPGPYGALIHPQQKRDLIADVGTTFSGAGGGAVRSELNDVAAARPDGALGELYGLDFYVTTAVPTANAGADRSGMMVSKNRALGMVSKMAARVEFERDASLRAVEAVTVADYGVGELDDNCGVEILSDA